MNKIWNPQIECMDREEIIKLQNERLRNVVKLEYDRVPLYRERMDKKGIKPEDIRTIDDLKYLPFTEKTDLRDTFPYGLFAADKKDIVRIQGSSGTTGKPIVSGYTQNDIDVWTEMMARTLTAGNADENSIVQVCYGYGLFTGGLGAHQGASKIGAMTIPMSSGNTQRQLMMMQEMGTTHLCCTPSYALYLGESIREMGIDRNSFKLRCGFFGAEPWTEEMRKQIEELLGVDALDIYGLTEIAGPGVSFECLEKNGMHVNEDHVIPEIIDPATEMPLPYGEKGELVFTTITKTGMPMLRYRTHDICRLHDEKCACGRTLVRMERLMGRTDDMLVIRGVNVFPSQIESVLVGVHGVAPHYMLIVDRQKATDSLEIQVEVTDEMFSDSIGGLDLIKKEIGEKIKSVVGIKAQITLVAPHTIPRSEGKAKRIIDKRKL
ncbi:MAG: phenylacetate--CoA ligase [Clostridia bacterium]|nr:phenylacetate--CoA ligase [Clostridia bacterium]MBQ4618956.1 phenylacetate--CoA ligase [Clostridia bacterium]